MAKLDVPPTKSSLLRLKRDLRFAREGHEMLEEKRQILVLELIGTVADAEAVQKEVQEKMDRAFQALREALLHNGALRLTADAYRSVHAGGAEHSAAISTRSLMGIYLSTVSSEHPAVRPPTSLMERNTTLDEMAAAFADALESIDRLAEMENAVFRLAREVRKTQRRVNALEKMFIPAYEETVRFITGALEERERDEFIVMRKVKERLQRKS
jgi:V/A-type H+-transporting ATPase subunit D